MKWTRDLLRINSTGSISLILIFLITTNLSIILDIPVFRQILGFIFLFFVPGALFLCILKPVRQGLTEKFVLSVGLSISFVMFTGLLINTIYPLFGYGTPLSLKSLLFSFTFVILMLVVIVHLRGGYPLFVTRKDLSLDIISKSLVIIPILFLMLSVLGMHLMNTTDNNAMLMALLFLIPVYVILIVIFHCNVPQNSFPIIIFLTSISLVLLLGMRSSYIIGADAHLEYYIFQQTITNEKWQILIKSTVDSCLSISILPVAYQSFLNINQQYLFKILYPILFSISPLVIYMIAKEYLSNVYAFLASIFLMSQTTFLSATANARTVIAILFVALSIMVLINVRLSEFQKKVLLIIFMFSCIVSHYSTTYIFFGILLSSLICVNIIQTLITYKNRSMTEKDAFNDEQNVAHFISQPTPPETLKYYITPGILIIFFTMIFVWYSQVTEVAFNSGVGFVVNSINSLQDLFILEARTEGVAAAFGSGFEELGPSRRIAFVSYWLAIIFIAIGVLSTIFKYRQRVALPSMNVDNQSGLLKNKIDIIFLSLALTCSVIMVAFVVLPFVSHGYGMDRAYLLTTVVLSSFFVLGGMTVAELFRVRRKYLIVLVVLVPFLMCTTGTMHQVLGYPQSMVLNSEGDIFDVMYIYDQEMASSKWIANYSHDNIIIYTDFFGVTRLWSQGGLVASDRFSYAGNLIKNYEPLGKGYFYLRYTNAVKGNFLDSSYNWHNISIYNFEFQKRAKIYSNAGSDVWM